MPLKKILLALSLLAASTCHAQEPLNKQKFIAQFKRTFPPLVCNQNHVFMRCFDVTLRECNAETNSAVLTCLKREDSNIPAVVYASEVNRLGQKLGKCIGNLYGTKLAYVYQQGCK